MVLVVLLVVAGLGVSGVKTLAGLHVAEHSPRSTVGLTGGLVELLGQVGAAAAGWPIGSLSSSAGWSAAMGVFVVCCVAGCGLGLAVEALGPYAGAKPKRE